MSILNTIDPKVAERWVGEYERKRADNKSAAARARQDLGKIIDLAEGAGLNRKAFTDELKSREWARKLESLTAGDNEDIKEAKDQLKKALGGLPLGDWGVEAIAAPKKGGGAVPSKAVAASMTLAEAKAIVAVPRKRGRASAERVEAERVIAEHDKGIADDAGLGASGPKAAAIAEAMGPDSGDTLSSLTNDDRGDNVEDLRPGFLRDKSTAA